MLSGAAREPRQATAFVVDTDIPCDARHSSIAPPPRRLASLRRAAPLSVWRLPQTRATDLAPAAPARRALEKIAAALAPPRRDSPDSPERAAHGRAPYVSFARATASLPASASCACTRIHRSVCAASASHVTALPFFALLGASTLRPQPWTRAPAPRAATSPWTRPRSRRLGRAPPPRPALARSASGAPRATPPRRRRVRARRRPPPPQRILPRIRARRHFSRRVAPRGDALRREAARSRARPRCPTRPPRRRAPTSDSPDRRDGASRRPIHRATAAGAVTPSQGERPRRGDDGRVRVGPVRSPSRRR